MMVWMVCEVSDGLRPQEATVKVIDYYGDAQFMPVDRNLLDEVDGKSVVPVSIVQIHRPTRSALVGLPIEADSGAHRIWAKLRDLKEVPEEVLQ